jgi:hypothetical protein
MGGTAAGQKGTERSEGVVGEVARPREVPERAEEGLVVGAAGLLVDGVGQGAEEVGATTGQRVEDRLVGLGQVEGGVGGGGGQVGQVGDVQRNPAVVARK